MTLLQTWQALPQRKRMIAAGSAVVMIVLLLVFARIFMRPDFDLLYTGLESSTAGEVVEELEKLGIPYEVKGESIYAPKNRRDSLRLELARIGLPRQNIVGYELFDDMNSFTVSTEMFDTSYWRAKEGEITRTILAFPNVTEARVHFGTRRAGSFSSGGRATAASVTLTTSTALSPDQIKAIQYVTALAASGLDPEDIAVVDTQRVWLRGRV